MADLHEKVNPNPCNDCNEKQSASAMITRVFQKENLIYQKTSMMKIRLGIHRDSIWQCRSLELKDTQLYDL